jgi:NADP-dependent 3-hydroxy acid dehydrogenase YdfG
VIERGRVALVTGGGRGIGRALAVRLAEEGANLAISYRSNDAAAGEVAEKVRGAGVEIELFKGDVSSPEDVEALFNGVSDTFGRVDILVNNAGVMQLSKVQRGLSDEWRTMFEVNVLGLLYATDAAIEVMKEQGSGHLVNISSLASRGTRPGLGVYSGTKFAVNAISESLRQELLEDNIRVTMVEPGAVETELPDHITDEEAREGLSSLLEQLDLLKAEDIANAVVYVVTQPERVSINEILIRPLQQPN